MNTIQINVSGEELETITIELTSEEVSALYKLRKEQATKIAELEKEKENIETNKKYADERCTKAEFELSQAHTLLTALGVQVKTNEEESYYQRQLTVSTRIALYIAGSKI